MADPSWSDVLIQIQPSAANGSSTFVDQSANSFTLSRSNSSVVISTTRTKYAPSSIRFSTSTLTELLTATGLSAAAGSPSNITVEGWVWLDVLGSEPLFATPLFLTVDSTGALTLTCIASATQPSITSAAGAVSAGSMVYLRCVKVGTAGTIYVNGVSVASGTIGSHTQPINTFQLGGNNTATAGNFVYFAGVRFSKSAFETTAFTPPTKAFPVSPSATGIASATIFGTAKVALTQAATGKASSLAFGTARVVLTRSATGIVAATAFGAPTQRRTQAASGVALTAIGTPKVVMTRSASGLGPTASLGAPTVVLFRPATGFKTTAFGTGKTIRTQGATGIASAAAFGTGKVALNQQATTVGRNTAFGSPVAVFSQFAQASGFDTTAFGTPILDGINGAFGFKTTAFGMPSVKPIAVGFSTTVFGHPSNVPNAVGFSTTAFGTPSGHQYWIASPLVYETRFGTPTTPTNRTQIASGFGHTVVGDPVALRFTPLDLSQIETAYSFKSTIIGIPTALATVSAGARGFTTTAFGAATALAGAAQQATALDPALAFGAATAALTQGATALHSTALGTPTVMLTQQATGIPSRLRFGLPRQFGPHMVTGFNRTRFGQPKGFSRFNHPASGFTSTTFGAPTCFQRHRATATASTARFGTPLLKRNPECIDRYAATSISSSTLFGTPRA
jgi:hypothetical protein